MRLLFAAVFLVSRVASTILTRDQVRSGRVMVEVFERFALNAFEMRDTILTMALESSDERYHISQTGSLRHIEPHMKANEREVARLLATLYQMQDDDPAYGETIRMLPDHVQKIVSDLQRMYVSLPLGTPRLLTEVTAIRNLIKEGFDWGYSLTFVLQPSKRSRLILVLAMSRTFLGSTLDIVRQLSNETGPASRSFLNAITDIDDLITNVETVSGQIGQLCDEFITYSGPDVREQNARLASIFVAVEQMKGHLTTITSRLPSSYLVGPIRLIFIRRGLELRLDEWSGYLVNLQQVLES